jgi:hypothetical protein
MAVKPIQYLLKTDMYEFEVAEPATPKMEQNGNGKTEVQKIDKRTGWPVFNLGLLMLDNATMSSQRIDVAVASPVAPSVGWRQAVEVSDLEIFPWAQKSRDGDLRTGVAFRASEIRPAGAVS